MGLSQQQMAKLIGVTYQQLHKYEKGINRVTAGQLHAIAHVLGTDLAFFFENVEPEPVKAGQQGHHEQRAELMHDVLRIANPKHRQAVCALAKALAGLSDEQPAEPA